jgi:hypothetical protein
MITSKSNSKDDSTEKDSRACGKTANSLVHIWRACCPDQQTGTRHLKTEPLMSSKGQSIISNIKNIPEVTNVQQCDI